MRIANGWEDYQLIDASCSERLENWKGNLVIRPDPQIIWESPNPSSKWNQAVAHYHRSQRGGGEWEFHSKPLKNLHLSYQSLRFKVSPTNFKHMGIFPEQAVNWDWMMQKINDANRPISVLNLFAYTGGATLACANAGATVCHVDAAKGMVQWAKENAVLSSLENAPIRWIVDDCEKFVEREIRRGRHYDGIVMDPPSYGRGPGKEVWQLEKKIYNLVQRTSLLLTDKPLFFVLNSYTTGLSPSTMGYILSLAVKSRFENVYSDEIGLPVLQTSLPLPCGATALAY